VARPHRPRAGVLALRERPRRRGEPLPEAYPSAVSIARLEGRAQSIHSPKRLQLPAVRGRGGGAVLEHTEFKEEIVGWKEREMRARRRHGAAAGHGSALEEDVPPLGGTWPVMTLKSVVLPAPFGP